MSILDNILEYFDITCLIFRQLTGKQILSLQRVSKNVRRCIWDFINQYKYPRLISSGYCPDNIDINNITHPRYLLFILANQHLCQRINKHIIYALYKNNKYEILSLIPCIKIPKHLTGPGPSSLIRCKFWFTRQDFDIIKHDPMRFLSKKYLFSLMLLYKEHIKILHPEKQITVIKKIINASMRFVTTNYNPLFPLYLTDDYSIQYSAFMYYMKKIAFSGRPYPKKYKPCFEDLVLHFKLEDCIYCILSLHGYSYTTIKNILKALLLKYSRDEITSEIHTTMKNSCFLDRTIKVLDKIV